MEAWNQFLLQLKEEFGKDAVEKWLPKLSRFDAANIYLESVDSFQAGWFEEHVKPRLKGLVNNNGRPIRVHFAIEKKAPQKNKEEASFSISPDTLDPSMTFENFLPSEENLVVYKLLQDPSGFNPIFIYGSSLSGKTHLLMATASLLQSQGKKVFYVTAQTFTEHVVQAIRLGQMQQFRKVYRDIDALIIDGIDLFSRKLATQEEFFHTFNTLHTSGRFILLSAHSAPTQLKEVEERLISRFEWGISMKLIPTKTEQILESKAKLWHLHLGAKVYEYLHTFPNPLLALQALALRSKGEAIHLELAQQLLKDLAESTPEITFEQIIKNVASHYGVTQEDLLGKSQMKEFSLPRKVAMYYCREQLKLPYQKIGEIFGRDHSTVMSSVKLVAKEISEKKIPELSNR